MAQILNGKLLAKQRREDIAERAHAFKKRTGRAPGLAVILVEGDPASEVYVRNKQRACEEAGIASTVVRMPADTTQEVLLSQIDRLNADETTDGILVQLPLPQHIDEFEIIEHISPEKDVDGFHPSNAGRLLAGNKTLTACTPRAVMDLIRESGVEIAGKKAVVVGRSNIVGKPLALLLLGQDATVTICHSKTPDLAAVCRQADILVAATGSPGLITEDHIKPGAVVIDVGITRTEDGLKGDVDFESASAIAAHITPVPGGVGPMTIAMLLENTLEACGA